MYTGKNMASICRFLVDQMFSLKTRRERSTPQSCLYKTVKVIIIGISGFDNAVRFKQSRLPGLESRAYRITQGFDSAAVLLRDELVDFAVAEERFTREKATGAFPARSICCCLEHARLEARELAYVAHGFDYAPHRDVFEEEPFYRDQFAEVYDLR